MIQSQCIMNEILSAKRQPRQNTTKQKKTKLSKAKQKNKKTKQKTLKRIHIYLFKIISYFFLRFFDPKILQKGIYIGKIFSMRILQHMHIVIKIV